MERISAFLFHRGGDEDPVGLFANVGTCFQGCVVVGMGFTFDDTDTKGVATSIAEMRRLIETEPWQSGGHLPYIGGEEVNTSPTHAYRRYVIDFFDRELKEAEKWPDLMKIVRERVKPERDVQKRKALRERWWQYADKRPGLYAAVADLDRVLVISRISNAFAFTFLPAGMVYNEQIIVYPFTQFAPYTVLQSRPHELWARFLCSTLGDGLRYTPSDCFETFPFPDSWESHPDLEAAGKTYYEFRAALMVRNDEGLTKTYNRFHDPDRA